MPPSARLRLRCLLLALALPACGASVVVDAVDAVDAGAEADAAPVCPAQQPTSDVDQNCNRYCAVYGCLGCAGTASTCESACVKSAPSAIAGNPAWPSCLACAVGAIDQLVDELSCADSFSANGQVVFTLTYPIGLCTTCMGP